jgi:two-component system sensor kinase FixL
MTEPDCGNHDNYIDKYRKTGRGKIIGQPPREVTGRRKDGATIPLSLAISETSIGGRRLFVGVIRDVTERKRAEGKIRESEERMHAVMENAGDGIVTIDESGTIDSFNLAAEKMFGYSAEEAIGQNVKILMTNPDSSSHDRYLEEYKKTGQGKIIGLRNREVTGCRKDGGLFPLDLVVSETSIGNRRLFIGIMRDISERKEAE